MTCEQCRQEIELLFGETAVPSEVQSHLSQCDKCTGFMHEQQSLSAQLRDDVLFTVAASEVDAIVDEVNSRIDRAESRGATNIVSLPRMQKLRAALAAAAAVVLMAGAGVVVQKFQYTIEPVAIVEPTEQTDILRRENDTTGAPLGDTTVSALLYEYSQAKPYSASEELLTEISEDEWEYLESEFDLGGLL